MNTFDYFLMVGDFIVAVAIVIGMQNAFSNKKLSKYYYFLFWIGCLIGATWEFTFLFLGPEFLHSFKEWPFGLDGWPRKVSHSIWDGGIFMLGILYCKKYLRGSRFERFAWNELWIMLSWGIFQELLVEYLFNGRVWVYEPLPWNPIIIPPLPGSATDVGYTLIPQAVWVIAPIIFYFFCLRLKK
jgi:hypothetical protein